MSYCSLVYHIVFGTYYRVNSIPFEKENEVYRQLKKTLYIHGCYVYVINGMPDHIHIVCKVPGHIRISDLVKSLKHHAGKMMKNNPLDYPLWNGWAKGYGAFSCRDNHIKGLLFYVNNQKRHHLDESSFNEYKRLMSKPNRFN